MIEDEDLGPDLEPLVFPLDFTGRGTSLLRGFYIGSHWNGSECGDQSDCNISTRKTLMDMAIQFPAQCKSQVIPPFSYQISYRTSDIKQKDGAS